MINLYNRGSSLEDKEMGVSRRGQHGNLVMASSWANFAHPQSSGQGEELELK